MIIGFVNGVPVHKPETTETETTETGTRAIVHGPDGKFASSGAGGGKSSGKLSSGGVRWEHEHNSSGAADKASAFAQKAKTSKAHHDAAAAHHKAAHDSEQLGLPGQATRHRKKAEAHTKKAKKLEGTK